MFDFDTLVIKKTCTPGTFLEACFLCLFVCLQCMPGFEDMDDIQDSSFLHVGLCFSDVLVLLLLLQPCQCQHSKRDRCLLMMKIDLISQILYNSLRDIHRFIHENCCPRFQSWTRVALSFVFLTVLYMQNFSHCLLNFSHCSFYQGFKDYYIYIYSLESSLVCPIVTYTLWKSSLHMFFWTLAVCAFGIFSPWVQDTCEPEIRQSCLSNPTSSSCLHSFS